MISLAMLKLRVVPLDVRSSTMIALKANPSLLTSGCSRHRLLAFVVAIGLHPHVVASPKTLVPFRASRPSNLSLIQLSLKNMALGDQFIEVRDLHVADNLLNL